MKQKKMTFKEEKLLLKNFKHMSEEEKIALAAVNHMSVEDILPKLQRICYCIANLSFSQRKELRRELDYMSAADISAVEQINRLPISKIKERLDYEISEHNKETKMSRDFNKAWKSREAEVNQQLIKEGLIKEQGDGWNSTEDFAEVRRRLLEAQAGLAREMGMHFRFSDPIIGITIET